MKLTTYVIHLKRAEDRQANVDILCSQLPGVVKVLDAVDSLQLSTLEIESAFSQNVHRPHYPFPLRKGEIACFMSNRLAWQSLIESNDEYCLIIEDDVLLDNIEFLNALELVLGDSDADSFVRFPIKQKESVQSIIKVDDSITHFYPNVVGLGTVMQLVGRNTAKKITQYIAGYRPTNRYILANDLDYWCLSVCCVSKRCYRNIQSTWWQYYRF